MLDTVIRPIILPLITAMIWGTAFVSQDIVLAEIPPFYVTVFRGIIAWIVLGLTILVTDSSKKETDLRSSVQKKQDTKLLIKGGALCGFFWTGGCCLQQIGMSIGTEASKAGFITALYVVLVPILGAIFFKKKTPPIIYACVVLAGIALYFLCIDDSLHLEAHDSVIMICSIFFALQILFTDRYIGRVNSIKLHFVQVTVSIVISLILALFTESCPSFDIIKQNIWHLIYLGFFSTFFAFLLQLEAQKCEKPALVTILFSLESVFATISGCLILNQSLTPREILGCVLMFSSVIIAQLPWKKIFHTKKSIL